MTYTAFVPYEPKIAVAVSCDLQTWRRLGVIRYDELKTARAIQLVGIRTVRSSPSRCSTTTVFLTFDSRLSVRARGEG
jgi:predicted GH43/DUF377 family glycosyl hydrolase